MDKVESSENEKESFYSSKGYIQVEKSEYQSNQNSIKYYKNSECEGTIDKSDLKKTITVYLKTFYGNRTKFSLEVNINETLSELIFHMISIEANQTKETFDVNKQYRLIATTPIIKELCLYKTYIEENILENQNILLLPPEKLKFNKNTSGVHCYLESKRRVVIKKDVDDLEFSIIDYPIMYGKKYIEFTLQSEPIEQNIIIGITKKRTNYKNFNDSKDFYGFILSDCKLVFNENNKKEYKDYGTFSQIGDKIGMMIELTKNERELSFYLNNKPLGMAFDNLPKDPFYPCVLLGFPGTKLKIEELSNFPTS